MTASDKLWKAFQEFRPHINGHKTAIDLFFQGLEEVKNNENRLEIINDVHKCLIPPPL